MTRLPHASLVLPASLVLATVLALAGCSGGTELVRDAAMSAGLAGSEPKPAPDFISRSRPAEETDYIPTGTPALRTEPRKNPTQVSSAEAEMEALRQRNEARGRAARKAATP